MQCGSACLQMISSYFGGKINPLFFLKFAMPVGIHVHLVVYELICLVLFHLRGVCGVAMRKLLELGIVDVCPV